MVADIDTLHEERLIRASYYGLNVRTVNVVVLQSGHNYYDELQRRSGQPVQKVEEEIVAYLDAREFQQCYPEAYRKWSEASALLWSASSQRCLTQIGHLCREALQEFATTLVERHQPPNVRSEKSRDISRIAAVLEQRSSELGEAEQTFLKALLGYWAGVSGLAQRQEHGAQREGEPLAWKDGRRVVIQSAMVMFEIDQSIGR